ncbi:hypothetical protein HMPREF0621_1742 [Pasteurella dagmatis ATCC 43325]|uniref:Uncharacterized protein n=1 Tax=Pasteurella dagmatis ATCC 43325 TaxID=667128 RepID=C9PRW8_9PAST|nr:hypothetical protein HMPREF0621_1742 [Pasteurella dagmatis ATCC 43325]
MPLFNNINNLFLKEKTSFVIYLKKVKTGLFNRPCLSYLFEQNTHIL